MTMKKLWRVGLQWAYLTVGFLTVLEFCFVRGMFTWLLMVTLVGVFGAVNVLLACLERRWAEGAFYILTAAALCMGYFLLA